MIGNTDLRQENHNDTYKSVMNDSRYRALYPHPYFDPLFFGMLQETRLTMLWSRYFYETNPIVSTALFNISSYPITGFVFETEDPELQKLYEEIYDDLKIREKLLRVGLDWNICGNSFVSVPPPVKRMLKCSACGSLTSLRDTDFKIGAKGETTILCTSTNCSSEGVKQAELIDIPSSNYKDIPFIQWSPLDITITHDEIIDYSEYHYTIPPSVREAVLEGKAGHIERYPLGILRAAMEGKDFKIYNDQMIHSKRITHSVNFFPGWGQPIMLPALKHLFHLMVLWRAQEALAIDQIMPWTIITPAPAGGMDPTGDANLGAFKKTIMREFEEWKRSPTHKTISAIPLNTQVVGAQGKGLMVIPEIKEMTIQVLAGLGIPQEFVYGGLTWSGSSVSLRMLENRLIGYMTMLNEILRFVNKRIHESCGIPFVKVRLQTFKMADDAAQSNIMVQLATNQLISKETALKELYPEMPYAEEKQRIRNEAIFQAKVQQEVGMLGGGMIDENQADEMDTRPGFKALPAQNPPRAEGANAQI